MKIRTIFGALFVWTVVVMTHVAWAQQAPVTIPDYSDKPRAEVPDDVTWDLSSIYASLDACRADLAVAVAMLDTLEAERNGWTGSAERMLAFYERFSAMGVVVGKASVYASLCFSSDMAQPEPTAFNGECETVVSRRDALERTMEGDILSLGGDRFAGWLDETPDLQVYAHSVFDILRRKDYVPNETELRILNLAARLTTNPGKAANLLANVNLPDPEVTLSDGTICRLTYAEYDRLMGQGSRADRTLIARTYTENVAQYDDVFAALLEGEMHAQAFLAQANGYTSSLAAHLDVDRLEPAVFETITDAVRANLGIIHRFYRLKQRALGLDSLTTADLKLPLAGQTELRYSREDARRIILAATARLGERYTSVLQRAFDERWIDWYANLDKEPLAYSAGSYGTNPYVSMSYTGSLWDVTTLVHELGHSMHSWFSFHAQHPVNADYTMLLAEVASTFNEHCLFEYLLETETDDLKALSIMETYMESIDLLVFSLMRGAELESAIHRHVEDGNTLTPEWLDERFLALRREYAGHDLGVVVVDDYARHGWAGNMMYYYNYYLYAYPIATNASLAALELVRTDSVNGADRYIDAFLSAGRNDYSLEILRKFGIDLTDDAVYNSAFDHYSALLDRMEATITRLEAAGRLPVSHN